MFNKKTNGKQKKAKEFLAKKNDSENWNKKKIEEKEKVKCHECSGYGHIRVKCPNYKKNKGKALNVSLSETSDSESEKSSSDDDKSFMAFVTSVNDLPENSLTKSESVCASSDSDIAIVDADQELCVQDAYNEVCEEVIELKKLTKKLYSNLTALENEKNNLVEALKISEVEVLRLKDQKVALEQKIFKKMNKIQQPKN